MSRTTNGIATIQDAWQYVAGLTTRPAAIPSTHPNNRCIANVSTILDACSVRIKDGVIYNEGQTVKYEDLVVKATPYPGDILSDSGHEGFIEMKSEGGSPDYFIPSDYGWTYTIEMTNFDDVLIEVDSSTSYQRNWAFVALLPVGVQPDNGIEIVKVIDNSTGQPTTDVKAIWQPVIDPYTARAQDCIALFLPFNYGGYMSLNLTVHVAFKEHYTDYVSYFTVTYNRKA